MTLIGSVSPVAFCISGSYIPKSSAHLLPSEARYHAGRMEKEERRRRRGGGFTSNRMNGFHVFSSAMVDFPAVTSSLSHFSARSLIACAEETDCANFAFERVYSWPGYRSQPPSLVQNKTQRCNDGSSGMGT